MNEFKGIELPKLGTACLGRPFLYFDEISSTNAFLKENAMRLPNGSACAAALQNAGKGRMGRDWRNIKGMGLMLSFLLHGFDPSAMAALPLAAGLGVSIAVEKLAGIEAPLKWSNDVLFDGKKLCGILCESTLHGGGSSESEAGNGMGYAVVGIGLNLLYTRETLDSLGLVYATSLFIATKKKFGEIETASLILNELEPLLDKYRACGFAALRGDYEKRCLTIGRDVSLFSPGGEKREAKAVGVGDDGSLICSAGGRLFSVNAGEVSVRNAEP